MKFTRQVHLDFHTSELIPQIGAEFSKENFQEALKIGKVQSITCFAKCDHSWFYYDAQTGERHPNLKFDLLDQMIDAAHEIGVNIPIYYAVGWSSNDAEKFPQCVVKDKNGNMLLSSGSLDASPDDVLLLEKVLLLTKRIFAHIIKT